MSRILKVMAVVVVVALLWKVVGGGGADVDVEYEPVD